MSNLKAECTVREKSVEQLDQTHSRNGGTSIVLCEQLSLPGTRRTGDLESLEWLSTHCQLGAERSPFLVQCAVVFFFKVFLISS